MKQAAKTCATVERCNRHESLQCLYVNHPKGRHQCLVNLCEWILKNINSNSESSHLEDCSVNLIAQNRHFNMTVVVLRISVTRMAI